MYTWFAANSKPALCWRLYINETFEHCMRCLQLYGNSFIICALRAFQHHPLWWLGWLGVRLAVLGQPEQSRSHRGRVLWSAFAEHHRNQIQKLASSEYLVSTNMSSLEKATELKIFLLLLNNTHSVDRMCLSHPSSQG